MLERLSRLEKEHASSQTEILKLEQELRQERMDRQVDVKAFKNAIHGVYQNMKLMRIFQDEKIDTVLNDTQKHELDLHRIWEKLDLVDEATMQLENKAVWKSGSSTPVANHGESGDMITDVKVNPSEHTLVVSEEPWTVKIMVLLSRSQSTAFAPGSPAYLRCASRGLHRCVEVPDRSAETFGKLVATAFDFALRGRQWTPLMCLSSSTRSLAQIPQDQRQPSEWNYAFLERTCFAHDKAEGDMDVIYIALMNEAMNWDEIRNLPAEMEMDDTCWAYDEKLDGLMINTVRAESNEVEGDWPSPMDTRPISSYSGPEARVEFVSSFKHRPSSLDDRRSTLYDYPSPPPYSQHANRPNPAATFPRSNSLHPTYEAGNKPFDMPPSPSTYASHSSDNMSAGLSSPLPPQRPAPRDGLNAHPFNHTGESADEHRHKRPRSKQTTADELGPLPAHYPHSLSAEHLPRPTTSGGRSIASSTAASTANAAAAAQGPRKISASSRTKRKVTINPESGNPHPPFHNWGKKTTALLHPGKGKEKDHGAS